MVLGTPVRKDERSTGNAKGREMREITAVRMFTGLIMPVSNKPHTRHGREQRGKRKTKGTEDGTPLVTAVTRPVPALHAFFTLTPTQPYTAQHIATPFKLSP